MSTHLIAEIERYLTEADISAYRFGINAARNGRLVERLRGGGRVWPETEAQIRAYIISQRAAHRPAPPRKSRPAQDGAAA